MLKSTTTVTDAKVVIVIVYCYELLRPWTYLGGFSGFKPPYESIPVINPKNA